VGSRPAGESTLTHNPALDGLRGLAVLEVLLYHGGVPWASGGFLGVEAFFVLSGYLITSLLVVEWGRSSAIRLGAFWARRARRLLPALFCLVAVIGVYYAIGGPAKAVPGLEGDGIATLLYYGNWHQIWSGSNYFVATGPTSPFQHTWSLAIEEQFYIVWPPLLLAILAFGRRRRTKRPTGRPSWALIAGAAVAAVASALEMAWLYGHGSVSAQTRVYYGTDTRAQALLVGVALALLLQRLRPSGEPGPAARRALGVAGIAGLAVLLVASRVIGGQDSVLYRGGFLAVDVATALVIAAASLSGTSLVAKCLTFRPLVGIGLISYGLYLWHFPLFLWLNESATGLGGWELLALRLSASLAVCLVSFFVIEQPVRRQRLPPWTIRALAPVGAAAAAASLVIANVQAEAVATAVVPSQHATAIAHQLRGTSPGCTVTLTDRPAYGEVPLSASLLRLDEYVWLSQHQVNWHGQAAAVFHTCPPKRVLLIGDSVAFTLGVGMLQGEEQYGVQLADAALLGCAFGVKGELSVNGVFQPLPAECADELSRWRQDEVQTHAQAVLVELGYRDCFDWLWDGRVVHLGEPGFDAYVKARIGQLVNVLGRGGVPVVFLLVPYVDPPAQQNGTPVPEASTARHDLIDSMLSSVAASDPGRVGVVSLDEYASPANHFQSSIDGTLCRASDGIHFTPWCGEYLAPYLFRAARSMIASGSSGR
jgi:peptidoglycan/LPS O-acetylase OafA/YrhL